MSQVLLLIYKVKPSQLNYCERVIISQSRAFVCEKSQIARKYISTLLNRKGVFSLVQIYLCLTSTNHLFLELYLSQTIYMERSEVHFGILRVLCRM